MTDATQGRAEQAGRAAIGEGSASEPDDRELMSLRRVLRSRQHLIEFSATHSLEECLQEAIDVACELTSSKVGFFHFVEPDQKTLSLQAWSTRTREEFCQAKGQGLHYPIDEAGVWTDCVHQRKPVIHNDYATLLHRKGLPEGHSPLVRELVVPVFRASQIVAILGVGNKATDYDQEDEAIADFIADLAWEIASHIRTQTELRTTHDGLTKGDIGVLRADPEGHIQSANPALCRILGYTEPELCQLTLFDIDPTLTHEKWRTGRPPAADLRSRRLESTHRRKDGTRLPVEVTITNHLLHGRAYSFSFVRDLTERRNADAAAREAQDRLSLVLEGAELGTWDWSIETGVVEFNERWAQMLGYAAADIAPRVGSWEALVHPDDLPLAQERLRSHLEGHTVAYESEHRLRHRTGSWVWVLSKGKVITRDRDGKALRAVGTHLDITERKHAEEALELAQVSIARSADAVYWIDPEGHFLYVNDQACRSLDRTREELLGKPPWDIDPDFPSEVWPGFWADLRRDGRRQLVSTHRRKDGTTFPVEISAVHVFHGGQEYDFAFARDITERKQAEGDREELIRRLEAKNAELERFTYTVSHDLRSPLVTIKGFTGALISDLAAGNYSRMMHDLRRVAAATDRMNDLLNDLLELSRIGVAVGPLSDVNLNEVVHEALELLAGLLSERPIEIVVAPELPTVPGDFRRIREAFQNLVENAVRFMGHQARPRIQIGVRNREASPVFFVADNGIGIDPQYHETVFGLFNKLDAGTSGTGIGLALVRRIIEAHGGRAWIESAGQGQGTKVCFTLPPQAQQSQ